MGEDLAAEGKEASDAAAESNSDPKSQEKRNAAFEKLDRFYKKMDEVLSPKSKKPSDHFKNMAKELKSAYGDAFDGLNALFGGGSRLGSGLTFTEESYQAAKPAFQRAWESVSKIGYHLKEGKVLGKKTKGSHRPVKLAV